MEKDITGYNFFQQGAQAVFVFGRVFYNLI